MRQVESLDDAITVLRTAAHLGHPAPPIPGTEVFILTQTINDTTVVEGVFPTRQHALRYAAQLSLDPYLDEPTLGPWSSVGDDIDWENETEAAAAIRNWLDGRSDSEIIDDCDLFEEWDITAARIEPDGPLPPLRKR